MFNIADFETVKRGEVVDVYFTRTRQILQAKGIKARVRAEFSAKGLPPGWDWAVLTGLDEVHHLVRDLDINIRVMPEGAFFHSFEPVMEIEGPYLSFGHLETAILGLICQASGVATMSARCRLAAGDKTLFSFGARRMHPAIAPMLERNAFVGGCDGVAVELGAKLTGRPPVGTMPHALILIMGDTVAATLAFDQVIDEKVNRVSLVDTFNDEKFETLRVAEAMGDRLWGVRLDTPGSRRGNFYRLIEEVRWELDRAGRSEVKIVVSGGLNEKSIAELTPIVDGFGVGTVISNAPVVNFSMDLVEVDGKPLAKRGMRSGAKNVWRCSGCGRDLLLPLEARPEQCSCGGEWTDMLARPPARPDPVETVRQRVLDQLGALSAAAT